MRTSCRRLADPIARPKTSLPKNHRIAAIAPAYRDPLRAAVNLDAEQLFDAVKRNDLVIGRDYAFNPIASTPAATLALSVKRPMDPTYGPLPNPSPDTEVSEPA